MKIWSCYHSIYLRLHVYVDPLQEEPLERRQVSHWKSGISESQKYFHLEISKISPPGKSPKIWSHLFLLGGGSAIQDGKGRGRSFCGDYPSFFCNPAEMMKMRSIKGEVSICFGTRVFKELLPHLWFKCQHITSVPQKQSLDAGCIACFYHGIYLEVVSIEMWSVEC